MGVVLSREGGENVVQVRAREGWREKFLKELSGKSEVREWDVYGTHGISADARPLMIHNGTKEVKNHNVLHAHQKYVKEIV